jgi:HNH endonuclease
MNSKMPNSAVVEPCIYCGSTRPATKREHVMSRALGMFEQNWTLDCVCDECNQYFADNLELPLGRDSREAVFRIDLGIRPPTAVAKMLNRRVKTSLRDPGQFDGIRVLMSTSEDGTEVVPMPVPQVGFRRQGEDWRFLTEKELTPEHLEKFKDSSPLEIRIHGVGPDCERLKQRLAAVGIEFSETHRALDQPITEQSGLTVVFDIDVDETIVRAACKIAFNYAAKVLGAATVRRAGFDAARRFVRYGEAPVRLATVQQLSILVGPGAESARLHACDLGWDRGYLVALVSLFNEITYGLRLCAAEPNEYVTARHFFDPLTRTISEAAIAS